MLKFIMTDAKKVCPNEELEWYVIALIYILLIMVSYGTLEIVERMYNKKEDNSL